MEGRELHLDDQGRARMVDVSAKEVTRRTATASALVRMRRETREAVERGLVKKGDVLAVAQVAGIMAAKRTPDLIPMCHPLELSAVSLAFAWEEGDGEGILRITARVACQGRTGVEMEAMTAAAAAALTVYDMCKGIDRWMTIGEVRLEEKTGGRSGTLLRG
jgi:cyclic pyranopterin phosphate synthase